LRFLAALAIHGFHNEFVYYCGPDEEQLLEKLAARIPELPGNTPDAVRELSLNLAILASYRQLSASDHPIPGDPASVSALPACVRGVVRVHIGEPLEEKAIAGGITGLSKVSSRVSRMAQAGLAFLGFEPVGGKTLQEYRSAHPDDPACTNLRYWHAFEQEHPETFIGMYLFWCARS